MPPHDLTVIHPLQAATGEPRIAGPPAREAASGRLVVGDIPREAAGFKPRPYLLAELDRVDQGVQLLTGMLGAGSTQLAAAYARAKLLAGWRLVAWVNAENTGNLLDGLAAVADAVGLSAGGPRRDAAAAGRSLRHWLETDGGNCLLVFDDVENFDALREFVPVGAARVLITSTRQPSANLQTGVSVDAFSADEALTFLAGPTGLDNAGEAAAVAAELGHLPLALAQAAAVIAGHRLAYGAYLDRLRALPVQEYLTEQEDEQPPPHGVAGAVLLSLQAVRAADRAGVSTRMLEIIAVLSAAGVRRELLHIAGHAGMLASGGQRVSAAQVDRALEWLSHRSLLSFSLDDQIIIMHRLVAQVIRALLARRERLAAVCRVAASVLEARAIALGRSQDRPAVRDIPRQVGALLETTAELAGEADKEFARILLQLRFVALYHLIELGDNIPYAIAVGESLTADLERLLGPDHRDTLNSRNSLAAAYLAAGRVADAIALFELTLAARERLLGPDHSDTLTSRNNLASAFQDAGRAVDAIPLFERTLAAREQLLGVGHPRTLSSRSNLAAAYRAGGRVTEAIELLEQTLADRERVLGPEHPDTRTSRKNLATAHNGGDQATEAIPLFEPTSSGWPRILHPEQPDTQTSRENLATAYRDGGRVAKAILAVEQTLAAPESRAPADAGAKGFPATLRRPPADPASRVLPNGFRRPPADPAGRLLSDRAAGPSAELSDHSSPSRTQDPPSVDAEHDREVVVAIMAGDPAGIAMAYDKYAAALYDYCHWMLHDSAAAAGSVQDTLVLAAATLSDLPEPFKLRPRLFALARNECQRRIRPGSETRDEADTANRRADGDERADEAGHLADATVQFRAIGEPIEELADATVQFSLVGEPIDELADATVQFRAIGEPIEELADATVQFSLVGEPIHELADATVQFRAIGEPIEELADATVQFSLVSELVDVTMQFPVVSEPTGVNDGLAEFGGYLGHAELRALVRSILADLKPREREVIELSFRHELRDNDLAIALGVSGNRAHALASRASGRLEQSFRALHIALAGREDCPVVGELLADWDGQLTEQTRDLILWHIEQCHTCADHGQGRLRPEALSRLLPLAPLPPELREQVLSRCSSTDEDAVAYRRRVVKRAESVWLAIFLRAIRRVSWDSIRANPGVAIATAAVAVWVVAAVNVVLLTLGGSNAAHALAPQPSAAALSSRPAPASASANGRAPAAARASPAASRPATHGPSPVQPSLSPSSYPPTLSPTFQASPSPSHSASPSPSPSHSASPSPSPSHSASPSPSHSASPSPSSSPSASP